MSREESKRLLILMGCLMIVNVINVLIIPMMPIYGLNFLLSAIPYGYLLCRFTNAAPRKGLIFTITMVASLIYLPFSFQMFGVTLLAGFLAEMAYMWAQRKKAELDCKISLVTTFNTMQYPLFILWAMLASQGEATGLMSDVTVAMLMFIAVHVLGFMGVKLSLKDKAEWH